MQNFFSSANFALRRLVTAWLSGATNNLRFFSGKALQVDDELRSAAVSAPKLIKATLGGPATRMAERAVGRNRQKKKRTQKRKK